MAPVQVGNTLRGIMLGVPEAVRDGRWPDRFRSIDQLVTSAARKFAVNAEHRRAIARTTHRLIRQRRPGEEIKAAVTAEAERQGIAPDVAIAIATVIMREVTGHFHA
jgi:hypothetical protein